MAIAYLDLIKMFESYRDLEKFNSIARHDPYGSRSAIIDSPL
jgi:hypothetical protein